MLEREREHLAATGRRLAAEGLVRGGSGNVSLRGAIVHGADLEVVVERALLLEWLCTLYLRAASVGTPRVLTEQEQLAVVSAGSHRGYGATR